MDLRLPLEPNTVAPESIRLILGLFTEGELAAALEIKASTLVIWRSKEMGPPAVKLGKSVFYSLPDVLLWLGEIRQQRDAEELRERGQTQQDAA